MPDRRQPPRPTYDELVALVTAQAERIADLEANVRVCAPRGRAVLQLPELCDLRRYRDCRRTVRGQAATPPRSPPADWDRMTLSMAIDWGIVRVGTLRAEGRFVT